MDSVKRREQNMTDRCWKWYTGLLQTSLIISLLRDRPSYDRPVGDDRGDSHPVTLNSDWTRHRAAPPSSWSGLCAASACWKLRHVTERASGGYVWGACDAYLGAHERRERGCDTCDYGGMTSADECLDRMTFELDLSTRTPPSHHRPKRHVLSKRDPLKVPELSLSALSRRQWRLLDDLSALGRYEWFLATRADIQAYQVTGGGSALGQPEGSAGQVTSRSGQVAAGRMSLRVSRPEFAKPPTPCGRGSNTGGAAGTEVMLEESSHVWEEDGPVEGDAYAEGMLSDETIIRGSTEGDASTEGAISSDAAIIRQTLTLSDPLEYECDPGMPIFGMQTSATCKTNSTDPGQRETSLDLATSRPGSGTAPPDLGGVVPGRTWSPPLPERPLFTTEVAAAGFSLWEMVDADLAEREDERGTDREDEKAEDAEREDCLCRSEFPERRFNPRGDYTRINPADGPRRISQCCHDDENVRHGRHQHGPGHDDGNGSGNGVRNDSSGDSSSPVQPDYAGLAEPSSDGSEWCDTRDLEPALRSVSAVESEPWTWDEAEPDRLDALWRHPAPRGVDGLVLDSAEWSLQDSDRLCSAPADSPGADSDSELSDSAESGLGPVWMRSGGDPTVERGAGRSNGQGRRGCECGRLERESNRSESIRRKLIR